MLELAKPQKDDTVLDVACGPGIVACELARFVSHLTGIDLTPAMMNKQNKCKMKEN
jgi:ubiquinone/menaquinone biosynthesis C-methylase UbiE